MKKYKFTDSTGRRLNVKARNFTNAKRIAGKFMPGACCIGWGLI